MKLIDRLLINHLELGVHPRLGAFFVDLALFSMGTKIKFSFRALKKALQSKWIGFYYGYEQGAVAIALLGMSILFWIYTD